MLFTVYVAPSIYSLSVIQYCIVSLLLVIATSVIGPLIKLRPKATPILLSVLGANCILTPGSGPISGGSNTPNNFAVANPKPAPITPITTAPNRVPANVAPAIAVTIVVAI